MNMYEAMFIIKPELAEEERKTLLNQVGEVITKNNGSVSSASVWAERKKMHFPIKKYHEGMYYLINFSIAPGSISEIKRAYKLNESVLRVLITKL